MPCTPCQAVLRAWTLFRQACLAFCWLALIACQESQLYEEAGRNAKHDDQPSPVQFINAPKPHAGSPKSNFGSALPPSSPHLRATVAIRVRLNDQTDGDSATLGLTAVSATASYSVVGCASGYLPSGNFLNSGSRILYRADTGCAIAIGSITLNGTIYSLSSGPFLTAPGSTNVFTSVSSSVVVALTVDAQLSSPLAPVGELASFTAHLVTTGDGYNMDDFLIVTPTAHSASVTENSSASFTLNIQGSSESSTTIHYSLTGTALAINDYESLSGQIVVPPGASSVSIPISLVDDAIPEVNETITLTLDNSHPGYFSVDSAPTITVIDDDIVFPTTGLVARYQPSGHVLAGSVLSGWNDSSGNGYHASQTTTSSRPTRVVSALNGFNAALFDGVNDFLRPPQNAATTDSNFTAKTFAFALRTGTGVTARQVIYRQGNSSRGFVVYVQGGFIYFAAYSSNGTPSNHWGVRYVRAPVAADTVYILRCVFDQANDSLRLYLDAELATVATNVNIYDFPTSSAANASSIGGANVSMRYHDGSTGAGSYFQGLLYEFVHYNDTTDGSPGLNLDIYMLQRYGLALPNNASITASATGFPEDGGATTLTITRNQVGATALQIGLTVSGTATPNTDYIALPTSVSIPAYQASATLTLASINDSEADSGEVVNIAVAAGNGYVPGPSPAVTVEIADDETYAAHPSQFIWYRASNVTTSGAAVTAWPNSIAGGLNNATASTTASQRPTYVASAINGHPSVSFDGGDQVTIASSSSINSGGPYSHRGFALVFRTGANVTTNQILYKQGNGANSGMSIYLSNGALFFEAFSTAGLIFGTRISGTVAANSNYFAVLSLDGTKGLLTGRLNGADMTSQSSIGQLPSSSGSNNGNSIGFSSGRTRINGASVSTATYLTGHIAEFMYFNGPLTWARISELENYFLPYYGL